MCKFFNISICCFSFFCVDHVNIVIVHKLCYMSFHTIRIKYNNQLTLAASLIIAQNIQKPASRTVNIDSRQLL